MGHDIRAALCADATFAEWAARANILCVGSVEELSTLLKTEPVAWIFSVANPFILPPDVFGRARRGAFNYHDGPLPRYAGTHATSWALLAQETEHGITWHRIDHRVDAGDLVVQRQVLIAPSDTALTLNLKCYEAAIEGFGELLTRLTNGELSARPQALADRSVFPKRRRPDAAGCLRWDRSAQDLSAMTRALDFGPYHSNPLCLSKALVADGVVAVRCLEAAAGRSGFPVGSLVEIHPSHWRVATGTEDVDVWFGSSDGRALDARALARRSDLDVGDRLPILSDDEARSITVTHEMLAPRESFWRQRLEQFNILQLPFLSSPQAVAPPRWQSSSWLIPSALAELSPSDRTEYLLSAWLIYLARVTGESELQLGWTPAANESRVGVKAVEVLVASVVPMEIIVDLGHDFAEVRRAVAAECAQLREHDSFARDLIARYPTLRGAEALRSRRPWPIGVTVTANSGSAAGDLASSPIFETPLSGDLLTFEVCVLEGSFRWHFDAGRLAPKQIDRMTQHLQNLLCAVMADAQQPVGRIGLLSSAERAYLLEELNRTAAPYPEQQCIHQLFEAQVRQAPDAVAVVDADERLSYGELNARANRLAHHLIGLGVRPDQPVAICLARRVAMVVGLLAILKAGGAYLPLDPAYPSARLRQVLDDAAPRLLLADAAGRSALGGDALVDVTVVDLETPTPAWAELPAANPDPRAIGLTSRHLAYVIYTSGSSGTPKGVMVEHRGLVNLGLAQIVLFGACSNSRVVQFASFGFDASASELVMAFGSGAALHLPAGEIRQSTKELSDYLRNEAITHATLPPALLQGGQHLEYLASQLLVLAGELPKAELIRALPAASIVNAYGPTEATVCATTWSCPDDFDGAVVPIGRPIANTRVYLLDAHGAPVPFGAVGELYIGGAGVARGYLNRPELTAERFLEDPFSTEPGARMYRSGDLARYLPDGNLAFLGRNDDQVKIRGFRIEPGEIAARLVEHAWVDDAVVVAQPDRTGEPRLVAYVVAAAELAGEAEGSELAATLRTHLSARLPDYMVPAAFVQLAALPLTPNGKLDRKGLPAPDDAAYARAAYEAPQGEIETALATIWTELLGLERVGRHDHFFALGGHSLLAVQLIERLRRRSLGVEVRTLFATPVLADLAASLGSHREVAVPANAITEQSTAITPQMLPLIELAQGDIDRIVATVPGGVGNIQDIYGLSPLQDGILFHHLLARQGDPYLLVSQMAFADRGLLERYLAAVQRVVDRHDILRTSFVWEGLSRPAQVVWRNAPLDVSEVELEGSGGAGPAQLRLRFDPRQHRIDLGRAPLLRFVIAREPGSGRWLVLQLQHHLIGDHTTLEVMHAEVQAMLEGREHELTAPQPFRNLAAQARLGVDAKAHEEFFRTMLGDIDEPTTPFGLSEVRGDGSGISEARRMLPQALNARLRRQARRLGVSLASLCHLAWGQVVARSSGREQVVFGTVLFGRLHGGAGADRTMGLFINTLPLRLDLDGTGVAASVRTTHARLAELLAHEHASLALAQRCSGVAAPAPLFSSLLNYRHTTPAAISGSGPNDGLAGMAWLGGEERTNYPLTLSVEDFGEALGLTTQVAEPVSADRVCGYMQRALEQLAEALERAPNTPVRALDILPPGERAYLLEELNRTAAPYPEQQCIHQLFEAQVRQAPDAVAVVDAEARVSYGELNARANRLAHHLIGLGVRPDQPVAICLARRVAMVVGLLAILKAGGAYLPLDPAYPSARLRQVLDDAAPRLLLADAAGRSALGGDALMDLTVVDLETPTPAWAELPAANPDPRALGLTSRHLAYVIYTSGSSGTPKGVMVEHRGLANHTIWQADRFQFAAHDIFLQRTSPSFDAAVWELWTPLSIGARSILLPLDRQLDIRTILGLLGKYRVTVLQLVPSLLSALLGITDVEQKEIDCLRYIFCGGELLRNGLAAKWLQLASTALVNLYGPTEATIDATAWFYRAGFDGAVVPIGRPIANMRIYLLDAHGAPVPFGAVGELYIGGAGVARGYLNRPELTAERFLEDPFSTESGARMYRSGDLARYLPDGNLAFLGRNDDQVKIRGFRIEPGEIAARLVEHAWVDDAVVVAQPDRTGEPRLVAYVVAAAELAGEAEGSELAGTLRTHLSARLPDYMVPAAFVQLAALPLTPNGKLDRKGLPAPDDAAYARAAYEPPQGEIETALAKLWAELLGVERVGRHDHFFALGGHSLLAVQLIERLRRRSLGVEVRTLFATPVLADLAASLGSHREVAVPANAITEQSTAITPQMLPLIELAQGDIDRIVATVPGGVGNIQDIYGLSPLQDGILFHHLLASQGDPYLLVSQMAFADRGLLERYLAAVQRVVDRHDILRTSFVWEGLSRPAQVVWRNAPLDVSEVELEGSGGAGPAQLKDRFDPRRHRIDLGRAPLLRFVIAREPGSGRWLVLQLQHHLIGDHTTLEVMHAEVQAMLEGREHELTAPQPFRNLAAQARLGVDAKAHEEFFRTMLGDIDEPTTPFGLSEVRGDGSGISEARRMLPQALNARLRRQARRLGVSLASLCHLAWGQVVARSSGREQVVFGTVLFGRLHGGAGADRTMGLFINTLPLRLDLDGTGVAASVRTTHARLAELLAHEHASLALAQRCSGVAAPAPLFSSLLNYRHTAPAAISGSGPNDGLAGMAWLGGEERTNYPLTLSVEDFGEALGLTTQVAEPVSADRVCGYMQRALEQLAEALERAPNTPVRALDILPPGERAYLLEELNRTAAPYPEQQCIHQLFEAQVRQAPDAVAVVDADERLSYGELNARANRLAHHLIGLGVRPDQPVAICLARRVAMVVGLLAILKAGGAYLPLDPAYPAARLRQVLDDAAPRLLLADAAGRSALGGDALADVTVVDLETPTPAWAELPAANPDPRAIGLTSRHLAYVIYTSGSTGTPKGVMVEHRGLVNLELAQNVLFGACSNSRVVQFASFGFDTSVSELVMAFGSGAALHLPAGEIRQSTKELSDYLRNEAITHATLPPALLQGGQHLEYLASQLLVLAGELPKAELIRALPAASIVNAYGPTEATVCATTWSCPDDFDGAVVPIGRPIANTRVYLLDAHGAPVPFGAVGELYIGGAGVARGYLNRPELTAERFLEDPFSTEPGARMYRSGDLARYLPDGNLAFLGRNDDQVKIRGFRIEPGEIAARLVEHAWVDDAVVVAQPDRTGEPRLVAYVVAAAELAGEAEGSELAATLRTHLSARLPDYMVPAAFVQLAALPLTPNGKLDRKGLPAPDDAAYARAAYEAPQGEIETALAKLWAELLGVERVGRHDHFFALGGHSLLAVQLMERLRRRSLGVEVRTLFATPVLADLAASLGSHREVAVPANAITEQSTAITPQMLPLIELAQGDIDRIVATVPGGVGNIQDIYGLSPLQDGILFHHLLASQGDPYLLVSQMAFADRGLLERYLAAVQRVVDRHDILRTSFVWEGLSRPAQVVWRNAPLNVTEVELEGSGGAGPAQLKDRFDPRRHRIDLGRAPLLRFVIAREPGSGRWLVLQLQHHLIGDHTTLEVMHAEVQAMLEGREHELTAPQPFRNLAAQARLGVDAKAHEEFFRTMLGDIDEPTTPFGLSEVRGDGSGISEARRMLPQALNARLRRQARRLGVSLASLCHLAWGQVVARSSGREQVVFGTVLFGRLHGGAGADRTMGLFINTLPLRLDLDGTGVAASVRTTHARLAELLAHEHASLALAQRCSGVAAPAPLFSSLLNYRHTAPAAISGSGPNDGLSGVAWLGGEERTNYPLTLSVEDFGEALGLTAQVAEPVSADRVCGYMQRALEQLAEALEQAPNTPVRALDILPSAERAYLVEELNRTAAPYPEQQCIHQLFEAQVRQAPDAVAVVDAEARVSYRELNARANRLAHHLIGRGVRPDQPVAICLARRVAMVVGLLAILKAGGAYLPLDPAHPAARLRQVLDDAAPPLLLADAAGRSALGGDALMDLTVVDLETATPAWAELPAANPDPRALGLTSRHLAYVIYTSGSSGTPKGVMVEHRGLVNLIAWHVQTFCPQPETCCALTAGVAFDASTWELWSALCNRSTLLLPPRAPAGDPLLLLQWWRDQSLDSAFLITPLATIALEDKLVNPTLEYLLVGGDRLQRVPAPLPAALKLINNYGPTEVTVVATSGRLFVDIVPHIGRPIANTRVYLLDGHGAPVPFGAVGELYIGGAGVARGYLNRPELTAERFLEDPFSTEPGARMYRSGDLARYLPDGNLAFLGRNDDQVKIRGFRIEPGEIAARLVEHASVRDAVVVAQQDRAGEQRLVAYVVTTAEHAGEAEGSELAATLRTHLSARLPDYMVPAAFVHLAALPLTPNGKLDRKALLAPADEACARSAYEAPQGEIETALAKLWAELLGVKRVGRHDHFFELGGHSLLAVQLSSRLSQAVGGELPLTRLFAKPVLADLAESMVETMSRCGPQDLPAIVAVSRDAPLVLSFAQQRLWFLAQLDQGSTNYHMPLALRLRGVLDRSAWQRSLDRVLARHEALRSVFVASEGEPSVEILPKDAGLPVLEHDLRDRPDADTALSELCQEEARTPFDLVRGPLIRARLIRTADEEHVFLLTQHHIVSDGWSLGILARELSQLYRAFLAGQDDPLPPLAIQYPDYAAWQRQWLSGARLQGQAQYWRNALTGAPARLALPTDRPRPAQQSFAGATVPVVIDANLTRDLKRLSRRHGTTLFMTVLAAWAAVLSRLSGQDDLVIGVPSANRGRYEIEQLIGFFVNTLALRLDLSGAPSVAELLQRTRRTALGAQEHQDLPFEQVVELVQPPRHLDHTPLFQVMLAWQNNAAQSFDLPGLSVAAAADGYDQVKFDLELNLREHGEVIAGTLGYATALFDQATIERQRGYLLALLRAMVADAEQPVSRIELLSSAERAYLLEELNRTAAPYPEQQCIHQLFEAQVRQAPDAVAVVDAEARVSYRELNARANRLAHHLIGRGVTPDQPVAICLARSVAMVVGLLAILKAGGAYLPLDPVYPAARLRQVLDDAAPRLLLADAAGRAALGDVGVDVTVLDLETPTPAWANLPASDPDVRALGLTSRHLAYVIYTSGSSGTPKAAQNEHRAIINRLIWMQRAYALKATDVVLQKTPFGFDVSAWEVFWTLLEGATLVLAPPDAHKDPDALVDLIISHRITTAHFVPSMLVSFIDAKCVDRCTSLRRVLCSGEALPAASVQKVRRVLPWTGLHNLYGPTEAAIDVTAWNCPDDFDGAVVPIGRPIANTQVYLLDAHGAPVPFGAVGELYIGGAGVARGYLNRPELTAERFLEDPFSTEPGARMYRSGDLARYLPDGNLAFLGRNDDQVKIRGFRIEPGEIAARLVEHASVRDAVVVVAQQDRAGEPRLVAYVVCAPEAGSDGLNGSELAATLRAHLSARLPDYMVPAAFVHLAALPLTPNGKLDRKGLPAPDDEAYARAAYEPPRGEIETALATIWTELLGLERVGRHDHFFALGGHSLLAVQLIERLRRRSLGVEVRTLFATPVLADLAASLGSHREVAVPANAITEQSTAITPQMLPLIELAQGDIDRIVATVPGGVGNIQDIYGLSPLQDGILFHHLLARQGDPYLLVSQMAFADRGLLERYLAAVQRVVDRHDILRTSFVWEGLSRPAQVVWRNAPLDVSEVELEGSGGAGPAQLRLRFDPRQHRIDLGRAPLLRFVIAREPGSGRWLVLQLQHHLIGDHTTLEVMHAEVQAMLEGREHELTAPQPFRNLAAQARLGVDAKAHEEFFRTMLGDIDEPTTPFGLSEVRGDGSGISEARRMLPQALNARLRRQARRLGVSLASLCHLAWGQVVARSSGREQVVFGTVLFGRLHGGAGADRTMGLFINTLPLRLDLDGTGVAASVRTTHARLAELLAHEHASLALAQRCSGVAAPAPLFSSLLNYRHTTPAAISGSGPNDGLAGMAWLGGEERTNYPLTLSVEDFGEALGLTTQVAEPVSADRVCGYMQRALEQLAEALERAPNTPVRALDILPPGERAYLLEELNRTAAPYPEQQCIHQLFEAQVRQAPDAVAVVDAEARVSYGELNARANRLAHHLIGLGVRPDQPVAICLARRVAMVVGLLAILKAGGAYLPLDPAYPSARLRQVLDDAAPRLLLADAAGRSALGGDALMDLTVVDLETPTPAWAELPAANPDPRALGLTSRHLAYVIYTSGSSGTPKGVMVEHRGMTNYLYWACHAYDSRSSSVVSSPLAFDATVTSLFAPLICGGHADLMMEGQEVEGLKAKISAECGTIKITPSHLDALGQQMLADSAASQVESFIIGGEALSHSTVELWRRIQPRARMVNEYGPTETVVGCIFYDVPTEMAVSANIPIGRPIANTQVYLLDAHGAPVPFGAVGELYIGGAGVARGYLNRPELTAERFLEDPFSTEPGARMYRSGDLARYLPDGNLAFLGRNDDQVKIRGFRIEPGEIAARLVEHASVRDAVVVVAQQDRAGEPRLVAYVVCAPEAGSDGLNGSELAATLRAHLSARLPDYMVPAAFVHLAALPLTPNGKLDRKGLPAPDDEAYARAAYEPPRGEIETALATIWTELLGLERVGRHDHFFELGGHSLLAVRLLSRALDLGLKLSAADLFHAPVLKELASKVELQPHRSAAGVLSVRVTGSQPPLFFVPTGLGDCSYAVSLVKEMDIDCPVYALPWPSFDELCSPTLEAIASQLISAIKEIQPQGPYRFAGYSSGAFLAYAIAQRLLSLDETVSFMAFIDVTLPANPLGMSPAQIVLGMVLESLEPLDDERFEVLEHFARQSSVAQLLEKAQQLGALSLDRDLEIDALRCARIAQFRRALQVYQVPSLPVEIHQFYATEASSPMRGWDQVLSAAAVHAVPIPGNHMTMMSAPENRRVLARSISAALNTNLGA
ncbi:non-ribosomal peptide synthase/polyketide synthase [Bradyrhizobium sp. USDA 10063]